MECKFIKHGIALSYDQIVKPCCTWKISQSWRENNQLHKVDLSTWHQSSQVQQARAQLESDQWPSSCVECKKIEDQNRFDSIRGNGNHAYANYTADDITLEIRPGNTCNFACQTCWPEASSRVAQYYSQAKLIDIKDLDSNRMDDFDFLLPIARRIRDVVVLGGEPFYDKSCLKFLDWAEKNLQSNIMMFTNGSTINWNWIESYPGKITLIFSLDAVGRPAEYIRYGTDWPLVKENYLKTKSLHNVETRVNVTCSVFNYAHLKELIEFLCKDWPGVVSFGTPINSYQTESAIPMHLRLELVRDLECAVEILTGANIPSDQKSNAINAVSSIVNNLKNNNFSQSDHTQLQNFIAKMDQVKQINAEDYCKFLGLIKQQAT